VGYYLFPEPREPGRMGEEGVGHVFVQD